MTLLEPIFWNWLVLAAFFLFVELISPSFFAFFLSLAAAINCCRDQLYLSRIIVISARNLLCAFCARQYDFLVEIR